MVCAGTSNPHCCGVLMTAATDITLFAVVPFQFAGAFNLNSALLGFVNGLIRYRNNLLCCANFCTRPTLFVRPSLRIP